MNNKTSIVAAVIAALGNVSSGIFAAPKIAL